MKMCLKCGWNVHQPLKRLIELFCEIHKSVLNLQRLLHIPMSNAYYEHCSVFVPFKILTMISISAQWAPLILRAFCPPLVARGEFWHFFLNLFKVILCHTSACSSFFWYFVFWTNQSTLAYGRSMFMLGLSVVIFFFVFFLMTVPSIQL